MVSVTNMRYESTFGAVLVVVVVISLKSLNEFYSLDAFRFSPVGTMMTLKARAA